MCLINKFYVEMQTEADLLYMIKQFEIQCYYINQIQLQFARHIGTITRKKHPFGQYIGKKGKLF